MSALVGWHAAIAARIHPHYLAYFSPVVGGPEQGYRHLVDSSLDWGQDLPGLQKWLIAHRQPGEPVYLSYFGTADPARYGINAIALLILDGMYLKSEIYFEAALVIAMLGFVTTVVLSKYVLRRDIVE